ncbi:DNA glycosylase [Cristinia sonorae]|uniref:DNA glycosylase n=1 Tax=Cristinia sonorae TaxID=1940300 RepID=A0A8K0UFU4_9AGAR|nr:DNA glycosylase [Cristinia sonorae]
MPATRSSTRASVMAIHNLIEAPPSPTQEQPATPVGGRKGKRKASPSSSPRNSSTRKKANTSRGADNNATVKSEMNLARPGDVAVVLPPVVTEEGRSLVPAKLSFSFEEARAHLIRADPRFEDVFERLRCKPFEHLEQFDPFSTLASSILGQQISWKAARSIKHRFIRLFNPSLPEKPDDYNMVDYFPTAQDVVKMDMASLRTAGLSQRKAEYVLDLAARFADGRLSTEKLLQANDEELYEMLIAVRGVGKWTVDMFAIFSLRRPDILPVGDLGVQRGVVRWFLALHSPDYNVTISPDKLPSNPENSQTPAQTPTASTSSQAQTPLQDPDALPSLGGYNEDSSIPPVPAETEDISKEETTEPSALPVPFTPSINKTLNMKITKSGQPVEPPAPLPVGMTIPMLRGRLDPKKKVKGAFLTPKEMEELTNPWRPYRSLGVYYMWALADTEK